MAYLNGPVCGLLCVFLSVLLGSTTAPQPPGVGGGQPNSPASSTLTSPAVSSIAPSSTDSSVPTATAPVTTQGSLTTVGTASDSPATTTATPDPATSSSDPPIQSIPSAPPAISTSDQTDPDSSSPTPVPTTEPTTAPITNPGDTSSSQQTDAASSDIPTTDDTADTTSTSDSEDLCYLHTCTATLADPNLDNIADHDTCLDVAISSGTAETCDRNEQFCRIEVEKEGNSADYTITASCATTDCDEVHSTSAYRTSCCQSHHCNTKDALGSKAVTTSLPGVFLLVSVIVTMLTAFM